MRPAASAVPGGMSDTWTDDRAAVFERLELIVRERVALRAEGDGGSCRGRLVWLGDGCLGFVPFRGSSMVAPEQVVFEAQGAGRSVLLSCKVLAWSPGLPWRLERPTVMHGFRQRVHPHKGVTTTLQLPLVRDTRRRHVRIAA